MTNGYLGVLNAWLCLFPYKLSCDWTSGSLPLVTSHLDLRNGLTAIAGLIALALFDSALKQDVRTKTRRLLILALVLVPYLPASNWFYTVGFLLAERVLYLPSMGMCAMVGEGAHLLLAHFSLKNRYNKGIQKLIKCLSGLALSLLLISHAAKTVWRNQEWSNETELYHSGLKVVPNNTKLLNNYGKTREIVGNYTHALHYYEKAMKVQEKDVRSYINAGKLLHSQGYNSLAETYLRKAIYIIKTEKETASMNELGAFVFLANVLATNETRLSEAQSFLSEAISLRSDFSAAYIQKGELLLRMNRSEEAISMFKNALDLDLLSGKLSNPNFLNNYGALLLDMGQSQKAFKAFRQALAIDPKLKSAHVNLAQLVQEAELGETQTAAIAELQNLAHHFDEKELNETLYFRLGMLALDRNDKRDAQKYFEKALRVNPTFRSALYNLALLLTRQNKIKEAVPHLKALIEHHPDHRNGIKLLNAINESQEIV